MFIGIVADDLTGAADAVAPFAQRGYLAGMGLSVSSSAQNPSQDWDVLALNTELRDRMHLKPTLVASIARRATRRLIARAPQVYFKKIDSTLRGHLRLELDGMLRELPGRIALICPASPAHGRTVENGILSVDGIPLVQTGFVQGTAQSEKLATVRSAFGMAEEPTAEEITLSVLREGIANVEAELDRHIANGICTFFCDAVTLDDLRTLAQVVLRRPDRYLAVGSAGFTRAIAESVPTRTTAAAPIWDVAPFTHGRVLVIVGSMHPISRLQAHRILGEGGIEPIVLNQADGAEEPEGAQVFRERFQAGNRLFVMITPEEMKAKGRHYPIERLLWDMAIWADLPVTVSPFDGYVVSGGHTAQKVCEAWHGHTLEIFGESEPGIVRALLLRYRALPNIPIILKAGGFGDERTLARCLGLEQGADAS